MATDPTRLLINPMQPRMPVDSFDLTRSAAPSSSLVTGDRSLTRNPGGRAGLPPLPMGGYSNDGTDRSVRRSERAGRRLEQALRQGDMQATVQLYRGPTGYGRGYGSLQGPPPGFGPPQRPVPMGQPLQPSSTIVNNGQPLQTAPLLPPPMSTEQALGMPGLTPPANDNPPPPSLNMPWQGQPLPGVPGIDPAFGGVVPWQPLPPSTMNGSPGVPAGPRFSTMPAGAMDAVVDNQTGKFVNSYMRPEPPPSVEMLPVPGSNMRVPMLGGNRVPGLPAFQEVPLDAAPADGVGPVRPGTKLNPVTQAQPPRIQSVIEGDVKTNVQWNPEKNRWERVKIYNPGDPDDNGIPGDQRTQSAVKAANGKTVSPFVAAFGNP